MTLKASGIGLQNFHRTGATETPGCRNKTVHTRTQEKGAVTPKETDPNLPVNVQEPAVKPWVGGGLLLGQEHRVWQCMQGTF